MTADTDGVFATVEGIGRASNVHIEAGGAAGNGHSVGRAVGAKAVAAAAVDYDIPVYTCSCLQLGEWA
jgi:hypothetical protein